MIRRTFHRKAKDGRVKANGNKYFVTNNGIAYSGDVTIYIRQGLTANIKSSIFSCLEIKKLADI